MKIGELAKQTGLSVRTLHYYDEIGLLSPSHRTDAEHRLYDDEDIIRLQQIMSLRQLGLSLKEIRTCLENPDFSLLQTIDLHRTKLRAQISLSHTLIHRLDAVSKELRDTQSVAIEQLIQTMETITMTTQYFTPKQQEVLAARLREKDTEWQQILHEIRVEMNKGSDLTHPMTRNLARRWLWHMSSFVQGDRGIYESLMQMYAQEGTVAEGWGMDSELFNYILKAIFAMAMADFTDTAIPRQEIFTDTTLEVIRLGEIPIRAINLFVLGTEGLLLGLLAEGTSLAAQALTAAGARYEAVQPTVKKWLGVRPNSPMGSEISPLPFAPRVDLVVELALKEAEQLGQPRQIAPEHLLLAMLEEYKVSPPPGGVAAYILKEELDIDLSMLEQQLRSAIQAAQ
ncbi:MAG: MerR family transcriptional regulator [Cyanobacteria bacterium J06628_6]